MKVIATVHRYVFLEFTSGFSVRVVNLGRPEATRTYNNLTPWTLIRLTRLLNQDAVRDSILFLPTWDARGQYVTVRIELPKKVTS